MNKIIENTIEGYTINLFEKQGYKYFYAPSIAPDIEKVKIDLNKLKELDLLHREDSVRGHWELVKGKLPEK